MDIKRFFEHWNLEDNPFQAEEARSDAVYRRMLEGAITHPDFAKIYGDPLNPSTTIVFGEKGSGKTAIRLMMERRLAEHNTDRSRGRVWVVPFDELNPMLDRLSHKLGLQDPGEVLGAVRLADHQDAILSRAVTDLIDRLMMPEGRAEGKERKKRLRKMTRAKRIDLATLALLYDQPGQGQTDARWKQVLAILKVRRGWNRATHSFCLLLAGVVGAVGAIGWGLFERTTWEWMTAAVAGGVLFAGLGAWWLGRYTRNALTARRVEREIHVVSRVRGETSRHFWDLKDDRIQAQPIPVKGDQDNRYDLTARFLRIIEELGYGSLIVLLDRVDEPVLINGESQRMRQLVWPMLNNKFLQQEQFGMKMLLPIELGHLLSGESAEFRRAARLDKQNVINPLKWTGTILYDLCAWRFQNCLKDPEANPVELRSIFAEDVSSEHLIESLDQMHQPRDAFKFLYAVILEHCKNTPGDSEDYRIAKATLDHVRRIQSQRVVDLYRGVASN